MATGRQASDHDGYGQRTPSTHSHLPVELEMVVFLCGFFFGGGTGV
jgi:hypothetical protein